MQDRNGECADNGGSHLYILEAHAHNEIRGPVGEASNGNGSWARTLAEEFCYDEPGNGARTHFKEGHKAKDGHDAQVGHPGQLLLWRTREKGGKLGWAVIVPQREQPAEAAQGGLRALGWKARRLGLILDLPCDLGTVSWISVSSSEQNYPHRTGGLLL